MVQIYYYTDIQQNLEDVVHTVLEGGGNIGETIMHDKGFVGAVSRAKCGLPLSPFGYADQAVSAAKDHLGKAARWREVGQTSRE